MLSGAVFTAGNLAGREALSDQMQAYVAQFVRTGDPCPDGSGLTEWQPWSERGRWAEVRSTQRRPGHG